MTRNIKAIDRANFERRALNWSIFTNSAITTEEFLSQIKREVIVILDVVASLHHA